MNFLILATVLALQEAPFPDADPASAIAAARIRAAENNRKVLVLWGTNESARSKEMAALLTSDKGLKKLLLYEYDLVLANKAKAKAPKPITYELPWVSVHEVGNNENVLWIESPDDVALWTIFLERYKQKPLIAKDVLAAGLKKAKAEKRRVLLTFGAPW
jgi:hypothetical protein